MRISEFDYGLPPELIAQEPIAEREKSRLLVLHRDTGEIEHRHFLDVSEYLNPGDLLVMNDTRVSALRLIGRKMTGAVVEVLLLRDLGENRWDSLLKPGRRVQIGTTLYFGDGDISATAVERTEGGGRILDFGNAPGTAEAIKQIGQVPLPPYIHSILKDASRYQTTYSAEPGSSAAPTAGLHFTPKVLDDLRSEGVKTTFVTLHIGIATFRPVKTELIADHVMHNETISVTTESAEAINSAQGRIIAVGTTSARTLESAAVGKRQVAAVDGETGLYITPGYQFNILEGLITNFHMPKSTLLILISAFAGRELIMKAYEEAKKERYRFLSFGDAMLIL